MFVKAEPNPYCHNLAILIILLVKGSPLASSFLWANALLDLDAFSSSWPQGAQTTREAESAGKSSPQCKTKPLEMVLQYVPFQRGRDYARNLLDVLYETVFACLLWLVRGLAKVSSVGLGCFFRYSTTSVIEWSPR